MAEERKEARSGGRESSSPSTNPTIDYPELVKKTLRTGLHRVRRVRLHSSACASWTNRVAWVLDTPGARWRSGSPSSAGLGLALELRRQLARPGEVPLWKQKVYRVAAAIAPYGQDTGHSGSGLCSALAVFALFEPLLRRYGHDHPDLHHAGLGPQYRGRPGRAARSGLRGVLRRGRLFVRSAAHFYYGFTFWMCLPIGRHVRGQLRRHLWVFRCCACAAIIWPSSPWALARSSG